MAREDGSGDGSAQIEKHALAGANAVADEAKMKLQDLAEPLKEKAQSLAQEQKDAGADQVAILARAVHGAADGLRSDMPSLAGTIHDAGARLERVASDLRSRDLNELVDDFSEFGRKQPGLVFGGAMIAGFALARFFKSSAPASSQGGSHGYRT